MRRRGAGDTKWNPLGGGGWRNREETEERFSLRRLYWPIEETGQIQETLFFALRLPSRARPGFSRSFNREGSHLDSDGTTYMMWRRRSRERLARPHVTSGAVPDGFALGGSCFRAFRLEPRQELTFYCPPAFPACLHRYSS